MLSAADITLNYAAGAKEQVAGLSGMALDCAAGSLVALLGPSGAGKSTLLKVLAGIERPTGGTITMRGEDWFDGGRGINLSAPDRQVGFMFQSYALWPHMSVRDHLAFPLEHGFGRTAQPERARRIDEMLQLLGLEEQARRRPGALSGGQQQRLALGRAMINRPRLLLLDEPLSNLDPNQRQSIARDVRRLQKHFGLSVIIATHDHREAMQIADSIAVMAQGRLAQQGTPDHVYYRPANRFVAEFVGDINLVPVRAVEGGMIQTAMGALPAEVLLDPGQRVQSGGVLAFRPEAVRLSRTLPADAAGRVLPARLKDMARANGLCRITLEVGGCTILVHTLDTQFDTGSDTLWLELPLRSCHGLSMLEEPAHAD